MKVIPKKMDFRDRDLVFVDLETTGLNPEIHEIIEIGCVVVSGRTFEVVQKYERKIIPENFTTADKDALQISGYTKEKWKNAVDIKTSLSEFAEIAPDAMLVGWNITFDWSFLVKAFDKHDIFPQFDYHRIDAMSVAYALLYKDEEVLSLGLRKVAKKYDIAMDPEFHGALEDANATYLILKELMK